MLLNMLNVDVSGPYFSILVIIVLLLFVWTVWGSKERLIIEGVDGAAQVAVALPDALTPAQGSVAVPEELTQASRPSVPRPVLLPAEEELTQTSRPLVPTSVLLPVQEELTQAPRPLVPIQVAPIFTLTPSTAGTTNAVLGINTLMRIKKDGIITITLPREMEVPTTNLTITPSSFGKVDSISNVCDSDDLEKLLAFQIPEIRKCTEYNTINIIMNPDSLKLLTVDQLNSTQTILFSLSGFKIPSYAAFLNFGITTSADPFIGKRTTIAIADRSGSAPPGGLDGDVTACKFGITLSDDSPGAKLVTANYKFSFTDGPAADLATFTIKKDKSTMYFLFSDDFELPSVAKIRVIVNKTTVLSSENGEYTLTYKHRCSEFINALSMLPKLLGMSDSDKFESKDKLCAKYYTLTLNKDIRVDKGELMISLSGIKNPPYYSPPAAEGKRDYLFKPFNSSLCVLNLNTTLDSGKYLMVPSPITYANAGAYFRGNYPIKNDGTGGGGGGGGGDGSHGDDAISGGSVSSRSSGTHAANVYTVNYFYDGQGAGEYGHISQPKIFGRAPYTYNGYRTGIMGSTSDASLAKFYKDYYSKQQGAQSARANTIGQIAPQMGVAPESLNGGVQPYGSVIDFG